MYLPPQDLPDDVDALKAMVLAMAREQAAKEARLKAAEAEIARLEAVAGDPRAGAAVLRKLELDHPEDMEASIVALEMSMLLAARQPDQALLRARGWLSTQAEPARWVTVLAGVTCPRRSSPPVM